MIIFFCDCILNLYYFWGADMRFYKTDELKSGMRIARPIYNKKGVLLYDRDSKLTTSAIESIRNFGLIGIYVLEPAEPLPPMTDEDREFERFQTVNVFAIQDELKECVVTHKVHRVERIAADISKTYGHMRHKIDFVQDIRSREDFVAKHSLNVAILAAMMTNRMNAPVADQHDCIVAGILHDIGKTTVPEALLEGEDSDEYERILDNAQDTGFEIIDDLFASNGNIKRICVQTNKILNDLKYNREQDNMKVLLGTRVMLVAEVFDAMTAMSPTGESEPKSYVEALRYLQKYPEIFNKKAVEALVDSINILKAGVSVELSSGEKALVISMNSANVLYPMVLEFSKNQMIDLSDRETFGDLEIVDVLKTMDSRYVMDGNVNQ